MALRTSGPWQVHVVHGHFAQERGLNMCSMLMLKTKSRCHMVYHGPNSYRPNSPALLDKVSSAAEAGQGEGIHLILL